MLESDINVYEGGGHTAFDLVDVNFVATGACYCSLKVSKL